MTFLCFEVIVIKTNTIGLKKSAKSNFFKLQSDSCEPKRDSKNHLAVVVKIFFLVRIINFSNWHCCLFQDGVFWQVHGSASVAFWIRYLFQSNYIFLFTEVSRSLMESCVLQFYSKWSVFKNTQSSKAVWNRRIYNLCTVL